MNKFLCLAILATSFGFTYEYEPLKDKEFVSYSGSAKFGDINLTYVVNMPKGEDGFSELGLESTIVNSSKLLIQFANTYDLPTEDCMPTSHLDVYIVDMATLNDQKRFNMYTKDPGSQTLGLFDPINESPNRAAIMLTEQGPYYNQIILAHEMAHFWYNRFCWSRNTKKNTEDFAKMFEKVYITGMKL